MAIVEVKVPQLSESVAEATLLKWKKKPGEAVAMDEILIEIETDKVVMEVPAPAAGVLAELLVAEFDDLELANLTALEGPQAAAIAGVLARTRGSLALPALEKISPRALAALLTKKGVSLPDTEGLTLTSEPGEGWTDDIVIPGR
jgi:2-oxoglutarate dehydrogenase E2 component (dihydrolipoamide succinyltransferase)